mmetsp:Transcript_16744/g.52971  ORF Transcript_16744/g.52971 Transcript_16744/m.52971 type:complete len:218 (+) Transcript_16744:2-655(+)
MSGIATGGTGGTSACAAMALSSPKSTCSVSRRWRAANRGLSAVVSVVPDATGGSSPSRRSLTIRLLSEGRQPSTATSATLLALAIAWRSHVPCARPATRLKRHPARCTSASKVLYPCTIAAAERDRHHASRTSKTGARSHLAICAVEPSSLQPSRPSCSPMQPSTMAMSAWLRVHAAWKAARQPRSPSIQPSRLIDGTPHAASWCMPSRKSGPTLKG